MDVLNNTAITELAKVRQKLRLESRIAVNRNAGWLARTLSWCDEQGICLGDDAPKQFWITRKGIEAIDSWLASHQQGTLQQQVQTQSGERKDTYSSNEKNASEKPMQYRVLVASCDANLRLNLQLSLGLTQLPPQANNDIDYRYLELRDYDYLVVVENRDSFNDWSLYLPFIDGLERALVVYRGHEHYHSGGCEGLKKAWQQAKGAVGLVYFGDADIAGLSIAHHSDTPYQHLLLPTIEHLRSRLDPLAANKPFEYSQRQLGGSLPASWQSVFDLLQQHGALRQQKMFNLPLELY